MAEEASDLIAQYEVGPDNDETLVPPSPEAEAGAKEPAPLPSTKPTYLIELGKQFGLSEEDMAELDADNLGKTVKHLAKQARAAERQGRSDFEAVEQRRQPTPEIPQAEPELFSAEEQEELHPSVTKGFKALTERLSRIEKALEQVTGHVVQQANMTRTEQIDAGFTDLGGEYEQIFGKGYGAEMKAEDAALKRRRAVLSSLELDKPKGGNLRDNVKRRALELFGASVPTPAPRPAARPAVREEAPEPERPRDAAGRYISPEQWQSAALAVPTSRNGAAEPNGRLKAERNLARVMRDMPDHDEFDLPAGSLPE